MTPLQPLDVETFRLLAAGKLGLQFDASKRDFLDEILRQRIEAGKHAGPEAYLLALERDGDRGELGKLATALTVTETYFFRNRDQFRAVVEAALPNRIRVRAQERKLRILSAACASGEEAYSLAMVIRNHFPELAAWDIGITAVDVNPAMLALAADGLYSNWAMRDTPSWAKERYFVPEGGKFRLAGEIRSMVAFQERNLIESNADLWNSDSGFDLIFIRNVLMYFVPEAAVRLVARMKSALAPGGYLFLGHAETMRGLSQDFHLCHTHDTFYYQRPEKTDHHPLPAPTVHTGPAAAEAPASLWDPSTTWVEAIQRASDKIECLAARMDGASPAKVPGPDMAPLPSWDNGPALDLLRHERFAEALEILHRLPPESAQDPDALLLHAVLLTNMGDRAKGEAVCRRLLLRDGLNAGAHYLMALCREHADDRIAAEEHDRTAIYLDAGFAMPWLHLGLLAKRGGRPGESRLHLEQALALLAREDSSRILIFGGGFGREALVQLCRSEIRSFTGEQ